MGWLVHVTNLAQLTSYTKIRLELGYLITWLAKLTYLSVRHVPSAWHLALSIKTRNSSCLELDKIRLTGYLMPWLNPYHKSLKHHTTVPVKSIVIIG